MSENQDLHRYVIGELRVDGWKSPWRIDLERKLAQPQPRYAKPVVVIRVKVPRPKRIPKPKIVKQCACGNRLNAANRSGVCRFCWNDYYADKLYGPIQNCVDCGEQLPKRNSKSQRCPVHANRFYKKRARARKKAA